MGFALTHTPTTPNFIQQAQNILPNTSPYRDTSRLTISDLHNNLRGSSLSPDLVRTGSKSLQKKGSDFSQSQYTCNGDDIGYAGNTFITQGVDYLRGVKGKPVNGARQCGRVSCEWHAAIWWCNLVCPILSVHSHSFVFISPPSLFNE